MRTALVEGEYYHIYNRGVDKRDVFSDRHDLNRFFQSMKEFNTIDPIGSIFENPQISGKPLVDFICYCLNPNHYHFVLAPLIEKGIEKFMHRLGTGYTNYFNEKYKRVGALFQGRYKAVHISSDEYLLHVSAYVNLNNQFGSSTPKLSKSSWDEYLGEGEAFCKKDIVLGQFDSVAGYKNFALSSLEDIIRRKNSDKDFGSLLIE